MTSRRQLEVALEAVAGFDDPSLELEQYMTPSTVAASLIHEADLKGDLDRTVLDLGTGTGMLAIAAAFRSAEVVIGIDIDPRVLSVAKRNIATTQAAVELVCGAIEAVPICPTEPTTVLMNPPFGAQRDQRGADRPFLLSASELASVSYSIHNAASRDFVESFAEDHGGRLTDAYAVELDIPAQFSFHDRQTAAIDAEAYRIVWA